MLKFFRWIPSIKEPYALYLMIRDPRTPFPAKLQAFSIIALIVAITISPLDIIPGYLPVISWLADLVLIPVGISLVERLLPQEILTENRAIARRRVNRIIRWAVIVAAAVFTLWAIFIASIIILIIKLV